MIPTEISPNVWVFTSSLYQTTTTVIRTSHHVMIVDPNWLPEEVYAIRDFVHEISNGRKQVMLFTHSDYDHIIGYGAFPGAQVIASQAFAESTHKETDLAQALQFDAERGLTRDYPLRYPHVDIMISEAGQRMQLDDEKLTFYPAKGHTGEGIFTIVEPYGIWIAGDYLSDVEFPLVRNIGSYRKTLGLVDDMLRIHQIRCMIPGHGTVAEGTAEILRRRDEALEYLQDLVQATEGGLFPEAKYRTRYPHWEGLSEWHRDNIETLKTGQQPL